MSDGRRPRLEGRRMDGDEVRGNIGVTDVLAGNWWMLALRGVAAIALAVVAFAWRPITLHQFVDVFGLFAVLNGGLALSAAFKAPAGAPRFGVLMGTGAINVVAGLLALAAPGMTVGTFRVLIALWGSASGFAEIACGMRLREGNLKGWWLVVAGTVSLLLIVVMISWPPPSLPWVVLYVGWWAVLFGVSLIGSAIQLRRQRDGAADVQTAVHA
jgi:uncharacterized membrane protein HdeD (DUF308 family)